MKRLPNGFGKEYRLHEQLKQLYACGGTGVEVEVEGCLVDVAKDGELIEIQTTNLSKLRSKLARLLPAHRITVVFPVAVEKFIIRLSKSRRRQVSRRRSPRHGRWVDVFRELPFLAPFLRNTHFSLDVVLTRENEFRVNDGRGSWRRGGVSIVDREMLEVVGIKHFRGASSYRSVLPEDMAEPFTSRDLASAMDMPLWLAQKVLYSLRAAGAVRDVGKRRNAILYKAVKSSTPRRKAAH